MLLKLLEYIVFFRRCTANITWWKNKHDGLFFQKQSKTMIGVALTLLPELIRILSLPPFESEPLATIQSYFQLKPGSGYLVLTKSLLFIGRIKLLMSIKPSASYQYPTDNDR